MCCMQGVLTSVTEKEEFNATVVDWNACVLLYLKSILSLSAPARTMVGLNSMLVSCEKYERVRTGEGLGECMYPRLGCEM